MRRNLCPLYIVDDEISVLESMAFMLESYGYEVETFSAGADFIDCVDLSRPGCLLLDSRMPEMRGQDVHRLLNEQGSPISVIYLTGHGDIPMAVDALKEGASDFFKSRLMVMPWSNQSRKRWCVRSRKAMNWRQNRICKT